MSEYVTGGWGTMMVRLAVRLLKHQNKQTHALWGREPVNRSTTRQKSKGEQRKKGSVRYGRETNRKGQETLPTQHIPL